VDALLVERNSQRRIVRATGVARMTITKRLKRSVGPCLDAALALPPPLLVLHRPVEGLHHGLTPLAAPALSQGRRPDQPRRGHQLFASPTLRRAGAQTLLVQQILGHAQRPN